MALAFPPHRRNIPWLSTERDICALEVCPLHQCYYDAIRFSTIQYIAFPSEPWITSKAVWREDILIPMRYNMEWCKMIIIIMAHTPQCIVIFPDSSVHSFVFASNFLCSFSFSRLHWFCPHILRRHYSFAHQWHGRWPALLHKSVSEPQNSGEPHWVRYTNTIHTYLHLYSLVLVKSEDITPTITLGIYVSCVAGKT